MQRTQGAFAGSDEKPDRSNDQATPLGKNQIDVRGAANRSEEAAGTARTRRDRD
jgi:hypothetical protein